MSRFDIITGRNAQVYMERPLDLALQFFSIANGVDVQDVIWFLSVANPKALDQFPDCVKDARDGRSILKIESFQKSQPAEEAFSPAFDKNSIDNLPTHLRIDFVDLLHEIHNSFSEQYKIQSQNKSNSQSTSQSTEIGPDTMIQRPGGDYRLVPLSDGQVRIESPEGLHVTARNMDIARRIVGQMP